MSLDCGDDVLYDPPPYIGDIVWCRSCLKFRIARTGIQRKWTILVCESCEYEKKYQLTAMHVIRTNADTHMVKHAHAVHVIDTTGFICYRVVPRSL